MNEVAQGTADEEVIQKAYNGSWILVTSDKGFGEKVYRERRLHRGVVFLRLEDERTDNKITVLQHLLVRYADRLLNSFAVFTERRVRFART
ncbi:MAG: DUF5615 family PIN-like protein [Candidatus Binatia bacterium]